MILLLGLLACGAAGDPPARQLPSANDSDGDGSPDRVDCAREDPSVHPGAAEVCDGFDQDCDGEVDEGLPRGTAYVDLDGDTFGDARTGLDTCAPPAGYVTGSGDCDDTRTDVYPGAPEACDGVDHDCDGATMDVVEGGGWRDGDGDGYGGEPVSGCPGSPGVAAEGGDCDDAQRAVHPGAPETCEGRARDEDCDGLVDDADPDVTDARTWSPDADGDGYGDPDGEGALACDAPDGQVLDATDCDDTDPAIHPWAEEPACTGGVDHDCDGVAIDADEDGDGWGACDDCQEGVAAIHPGAPEACDALDNNCDGAVDEGLPVSTWYEDRDHDGYGNPAVSGTGCDAPEASADRAGDCDDLSSSVRPGAVETCRTAYDDDCDGDTNDAGATSCGVWYHDGDGDGYGDGDDSNCQCVQDEQWSTLLPDDCADDDPAVNPGAVDVCGDGVDTDCDGFDGCTQDELPQVVAGTEGGDRLGDEFALAPDLDGDGVDDLAVAAPAAGTTGEVVFYAGPIGPWSPPVIARWAGSDVRSYHGVGSQLAFGDDDGDGITDVIVGDRSWSDVGSGEAGLVATLRGPLAPEGDVATDATARFFGDSSAGGTGNALAWAGDLADDGVARLAVGDEATAAWRNGAVYLLPTGVGGDRHPSDVVDLVTSDTATDLGATVAAGTDLDGDGLVDLVAGCGAGALVFFGPVAGVRPASTADLTLTESPPYAQRIVDDLDGDGVADLLLRSSSSLRLYAGLSAGARTTADALFTLVDGYAADSAIDAPALADLDGDGRLDLAYGRPNLNRSTHEGGVYVVLGPLLGTYDIEDAQGWVGSAPTSYLGMGVQGVGDVDADGRDDVLVSARKAAREPNDLGELRLLLGAYVR